MPTYPLTVMDLFSLSDPGRRLTDPEIAYQAMQLSFGWQTVMGTAAAPGPLVTQAVNVVRGPPLGTGSLHVLLPIGLAGRFLTIINLSSSTVLVDTSYNSSVTRPDEIVYGAGQLPLGIGSITNFLAYEPGLWILLPTTSPPVPTGE